jgi:gliding motility-associated-like protein
MLTTSNGGKCFSKDSVTVVIENRPTTRPIVTSKKDTLFSNISTNIRWYDSKGVLIPGASGRFYSPISEGKYYATTGNGRGCESDTSIGVNFVPVLPTASMLSTTYTVTEGDPVNITISLTGTAPWKLYAKANGTPLPAFNITRSPYNWQVFDAGIYTLDSLIDGKERKGRVSGTANVVVRPFIGSTANTESKEYLLRQITDTAKVKISLRGTAPFTLYLTYEGVERIIPDIRDTAYIFKTFQQGTYRLTRIFDATGVAGKVNGTFTVKFQSQVNSITANIASNDTLRGNQPANVIFSFTGKAPWTVLWSIDGEAFPSPLTVRKSPDTLKVFKDGIYRLLTVIDAEGNQALISGEAKVVKPAIPRYTGTVSGNGSLNESDTIYITFKYDGNKPWTLIYGNDLGYIDTVLVTTNEYVAKVYNRGVYRIIKIIDGKSNIPSEIITKGEAKVNLELVTKDAFSPNGDDINEQFEFKGLNLFEVNQLFIYNREGQPIFDSENYKNEWDGKDKSGKVVPDGVYYFTLKSMNKSKASEPPVETYGFIEIRR